MGFQVTTNTKNECKKIPQICQKGVALEGILSFVTKKRMTISLA
jgi:hypothetical protein